MSSCERFAGSAILAHHVATASVAFLRADPTAHVHDSVVDSPVTRSLVEEVYRLVERCPHPPPGGAWHIVRHERPLPIWPAEEIRARLAAQGPEVLGGVDGVRVVGDRPLL